MSEPKIDWYRTPVDKALMRQLTAKSDAKGMGKAGTFLLLWLALAAAALVCFLNQWWIPMVVACYLTSMIQNFMGMATGVHELSHGTMFKTKALNEFFYHLFCWLTWNNPVHFRASRGLHHQLTVFKDPDKEVVQGPVENKLNTFHLLIWFTFDVEQFASWMSRTVLHALGKADADYFFWNPLFEKGDKRRGQMVGWARFALISHLVLLGIFVGFHLWVLIYIVTFGVFFGSWYAKLCGAMQHTGLGENTPDWRLVCHTFTGGPLTKFLYWNMNYHIEHHMYAAVPCYHLPRLHRALAHDLPPCQKSLWSGLRLLSQIKAKQKSDPSYVYVPLVTEKF
jgi:fatty acid desaturase